MKRMIKVGAIAMAGIVTASVLSGCGSLTGEKKTGSK